MNKITQKIQGVRDKAKQKILDKPLKQGFSQYEADYPEARADWWQTRSHRAPADFFPKEWRAFIKALEEYELDPAGNANRLTASISRLRCPGTSYVGELKKWEQAKWWAKRAAGGMGHDNFLLALENLSREIAPKYEDPESGELREIPLMYQI